MSNISDIWQFDLRHGNSDDPRNGACLLDAVSWFEYGVLGDHPECVCPIIAAFGRSVNDAMNDAGRQRLKVFIPRLVGTVDPEAERARAEYLAWQAIRVFAPISLDAVGLHDGASKLRSFDGSLSDAVDAARAAAKAAAWAAEAASAAVSDVARAARAADAAEAVAVEDAIIDTMDGVLRIGRQAEPIAPERIASANRLFAIARGELVE